MNTQDKLKAIVGIIYDSGISDDRGHANEIVSDLIVGREFEFRKKPS